jgi:hypothetical protein
MCVQAQLTAARAKNGLSLEVIQTANWTRRDCRSLSAAVSPLGNLGGTISVD